MNQAYAPADHARVLREAAERTRVHLGLPGFDNASIVVADAWIDSPDFRSAYDVAAYLGEAIIRRHGGSWSLGARGPCIAINRNGHHFIDPFSKVQKRVVNGREDHLLGLVHLVEHVVTKPKLDAYAVSLDAFEQLALGEDDSGSMSGGRAIGLLLLALIGVPLAVLVALLFVTDASYALIGGAAAIPFGLVGFAVLARGKQKRAPWFSPMPLAWEAQLTIPPLEQRLSEKLHALDAHPSQDALAEVAFYTAQLRELRGIVDRRDPSPGRGYVGFDVYSAGRVSSWSIRTRSL